MDKDKVKDERDVPCKPETEKINAFFRDLYGLLQVHGYSETDDEAKKLQTTPAPPQKKEVSPKGSDWIPSIYTFEDFRRIALQSLDGFMIVLNADGVIIFVAENVSPLLGYSPDEIVGKRLLSLLPEEEKRDVYQRINLRFPVSDIGKHNEFCCHLRKGQTNYGGSPTYEYVKFIISVKDLANDPPLLLKTCLPRQTYSASFPPYLPLEDRYYMVGTVCVLRSHILRELTAFRKSSEDIITIQDSDDEDKTTDYRLVQCRLTAGMPSVTPQSPPSDSDDEVEIIEPKECEVYIPLINLDSDSSSTTSVPACRSPGISSVPSFEIKSEMLGLHTVAEIKEEDDEEEVYEVEAVVKVKEENEGEEKTDDREDEDEDEVDEEEEESEVDQMEDESEVDQMEDESEVDEGEEENGVDQMEEKKEVDEGEEESGVYQVVDMDQMIEVGEVVEFEEEGNDEVDKTEEMAHENPLFSTTLAGISAELSEIPLQVSSYTRKHELELTSVYREQLEEKTQMPQTDLRNQQDTMNVMRGQFNTLKNPKLQMVVVHPLQHFKPLEPVPKRQCTETMNVTSIFPELTVTRYFHGPRSSQPWIRPGARRESCDASTQTQPFPVPPQLGVEQQSPDYCEGENHGGQRDKSGSVCPEAQRKSSTAPPELALNPDSMATPAGASDSNVVEPTTPEDSTQTWQQSLSPEPHFYLKVGPWSCNENVTMRDQATSPQVQIPEAEAQVPSGPQASEDPDEYSSEIINYFLSHEQTDPDENLEEELLETTTLSEEEEAG